MQDKVVDKWQERSVMRGGRRMVWQQLECEGLAALEKRREQTRSNDSDAGLIRQRDEAVRHREEDDGSAAAWRDTVPDHTTLVKETKEKKSMFLFLCVLKKIGYRHRIFFFSLSLSSSHNYPPSLSPTNARANACRLSQYLTKRFQI